MPGGAIHWFDTIDSTMFEAARLAAAGCSSGTVVAAGEQTAGHGRHGRKWHSEKDAGLYASFVLRLPLAPEDLPVVTLSLGLATVEAIAETSGAVCDLRWPNDVLIGPRKCAGILAEFEHGAVIAGIGVNVNHTAFPEEIAAVATSLRIATGRETAPKVLLDALSAAIERHTAILVAEGREAVLRLFSRASSYVAGRRVTVDLEGETVTGTTAGLDPGGFLLLREDGGALRTILAGGVRPISCS